MILARCFLAVDLLAIVAWIVAWRRARPDLCPLWLALKLSVLLMSIAAAAVASAIKAGAFLPVVLVVADVVGAAVAIRLWAHRARLLAPAEAAGEARRLADAALDMAKTAEREAKGGGRVA